MTHRLVLFLVNKSKILDEPVGFPNRRRIFNEAFSAFTWPSHVGRLASNVISQITSGGEGNAVKADEWNRVRTALPAALWLALRDPATDRIATKEGQPRIELYRTVVDVTAALRILLGRSISVHDAEQAQELLAGACRSLLRHGMRLTINWHVAMHYARSIELYGPVGGFATWPFERNNGVLARTRFFKGDTVQMTSTASRRWLKEQLLSAVLDNPAATVSEVETAYIDDLKSRLNRQVIQGTLLLDEHRSRAASRVMKLPSPIRTALDLRKAGLYELTLSWLQSSLPHLLIRSEWRIRDAGLSMPAKGHEEFSSVLCNGYR